MEEGKLTANQLRLRKNIRSTLGTTLPWAEVIQDMEFVSTVNGEGENYKCECGHPINDVFIIKHTKTKDEFVIGSTCIKQFIENEDIYCKLINAWNLIHKCHKKKISIGKYKGKKYKYVAENHKDYGFKLLAVRNYNGEVNTNLIEFLDYFCYYKNSMKKH